MTEAHEPDRMHAITDETWDTVDEVLDYARRRALFENVPLDKPLTPERPLAPRVGLDHRRGHRRAARDRPVRERARAGVRVDRPPGLPVVHPVRPDEGGASRSTSSCRHPRSTAGSWMEGSGAVFAENEVLHWLAAEFGLPEGAGGVFVQGGTIGNLSALVAARDAARRRNREAGRPDPARWVVVCSAEAHSSIASAAAVMDVDVVDRGAGRRRAPPRRRRRRAPSTSTARRVRRGRDRRHHELRDRRRHRLDRRRDHATATSGCTSTAPTGWRRCSSSGCAPPSPASSAPTRSSSIRTSGCSRRSTRARSSIATPSVALAAHTQKAEYLDTLTESADWNPSDLAIQLTRRARGLPLWFSLATHGTEHYRAAVDSGIPLARRIADEITARDGLSLVRDPQLSVVVFRRDGWTPADYQAWSDRLLEEQEAFVVPSSHAARRSCASRSSVR